MRIRDKFTYDCTTECLWGHVQDLKPLEECRSNARSIIRNRRSARYCPGHHAVVMAAVDFLRSMRPNEAQTWN